MYLAQYSATLQPDRQVTVIALDPANKRGLQAVAYARNGAKLKIKALASLPSHWRLQRTSAILSCAAYCRERLAVSAGGCQ